ncbi:putative amidoligase enzyme-domain-containing protein [Xylariales sp. PMI_506]|nr:putative amidoligase enzyme-domain-containing protein [Xylariales sp. PMI_506]
MTDQGHFDGGQLLTFGVEIEFLVAYLGPNSRDPCPDDPRNVYISKGLRGFENLPYEDEVHPLMKTRKMRYRIVDQWRGSSFHDHGPHIRHRIAKFLRNNGIPAVSDSGDWETNCLFASYFEDTAQQLHFPPSMLPKSVEESTLWMVETDQSLQETGHCNYVWMPVEIKSPVLLYSEESIRLVQSVTSLLLSEFRILCNESCMLHVHIGRGGCRYSMNNLRMIASILYAAAPRLDQLHPIHCGPLTPWAPGIRTHSLMANLDQQESHQAMVKHMTPSVPNPLLSAPEDREASRSVPNREVGQVECYVSTFSMIPLLDQWKGHQRATAFGLTRIWRASTAAELYECVGTVFNDPEHVCRHFRSAYNFQTTSTRFSITKKADVDKSTRNILKRSQWKHTIEFRQHAGTLSSEAIGNWIRVTVGIIDFCVHAPFDSGISPVLRRLERPDTLAQASWEANEPFGDEKKINVTHTLSSTAGEMYTVYDFLWDINRGAQAEYYRARGLHPLPPDAREIPVVGESEQEMSRSGVEIKTNLA